MSQLLPNYIDGQCLDSASEEVIPIINPATEEELCLIPDSDAIDVGLAVNAAKKALPEWRQIPPVARARILFRFRDQLEKHQKELAAVISREHGKTVDDALAEISRALDVVEFACGIPRLLKGEHSQNVGRGVNSWSEMHPVGVCAGITPFNFPAMVPLWMFPIAIGCGNTFILKPSEQDPSAPAMFPEMLQKAGLPDGVFNILHGSANTVNGLLKHPDIRAISFVGSTRIAEHIYRTGSESGKRIQALGGAKNHAVVMADADLDLAVDQLVGAAYGSAGERCMAISVVVTVGEKTADALVAKLAERVSKLTIGSGDRNPDMGPLISKGHRERVLKLIESGLEDGAILRVDGRHHGMDKGWFLGGCLFDHVLPGMQIYQNEIFGPVLCVVRVSSYGEAISLVHQHEYGNGSAIFTGCGKTARQFCEDSETGMVGVNVPIPVPAAWHCFGGWKRSLFGPLHMHGPDGVRFFTRMKTITARWPFDLPGQNMNMPILTKLQDKSYPADVCGGNYGCIDILQKPEKIGSLVLKTARTGENFPEKAVHYTQKEIDVYKDFAKLKNRKHPGAKYVASLIGWLVERETQTSRIQRIVLIMPNYGLALDIFIRQHPENSIDTIHWILLHIAQGLNFIHSRQLIHCDLKTENCVIDFANKRAVIIDYGLGLYEQEVVEGSEKNVRGTWLYMAPEIISYLNNSICCDIWAYGIIALKLFEFRILMILCLDPDPSKRIETEKIIEILNEPALEPEPLSRSICVIL